MVSKFLSPVSGVISAYLYRPGGPSRMSSEVTVLQLFSSGEVVP